MKQLRKSPDWLPPVDVEIVQEHIRFLKESCNLGTLSIHQKTKLSTTTIFRIRNGMVSKVRGKTAAKILAVGRDYYAPCEEAREHLLWLQSQGIGTIRVNLVTGVDERTINAIRLGHRKFTNEENVIKILAVGTHMFVDYKHLPMSERHRGVGVVSDYLSDQRAS